MNWDNFLSSGYTFNDEENELASRYTFVNILLLILFVLVSFTIMIYRYMDYGESVQVYYYSLSLIVFSLYIARKIGKNNYVVFTYIINVGFFIIIVIGHFNDPDIHPLIAWAIIQIFISFLTLNNTLSLIVTGMYVLLIVVWGIYFHNDTIKYILLKTTPLFFSYIMVFILNKKIFEMMILLDKTNKNLENSIANRTKEIEIEKGKLYHQANYDFLTALPNRNNFYTTIRYWIDNDIEKKLKFALFFIDIDRFKRINDSLGHEAGDFILKAVSKRINKVLPNDSFLYRISGDEFTLLLKYNDDKEIRRMVNNIQKAIHNPILIQNQSLNISVSIGIAMYPYDSVYHVDLIRYADISMFEAKRSGIGLCKYYSDDMTQKLQKNVILESELYSALKNNEFELFYQSQIDIHSNVAVTIEALIRWRHPKLGMVTPDSFIPLSETIGLIVSIDYYVLKSGMKQIVQWRKNSLNLPRISFNISSKHLKDKLFVQKIKNFLNETSCRAEWVELEITESYVMEELEEAIEILTALRELGFTIAIDDFGTGYTSLAYLEKLPVDKLKIDKYFISNIDTNNINQTIVSSIINIAHSIGLKVVAEGVETELEKEYLIDVGCYITQGYLHCRPMSGKHMEEKLSMSL